MVQSIKDYSLQNISNRINLRRSQTSIVCIKFPVFFRWRAMQENVCKGLDESTKNCWSSLQDVDLERQSPLSVFLRDKTIFDFFFFDKGAWRHVSSTRTCTQKMSYLHVFPEKGRFSPYAQGKNIMISGKNTIFPDNTRKIMRWRGPFGKTIFSESLKKIYLRVFF